MLERHRKKKFALEGTQLKPIVLHRGACIATDTITVEGKKVGYMVHGKPINRTDSGWRFFSGEESQAYLDDASHWSPSTWTNRPLSSSLPNEAPGGASTYGGIPEFIEHGALLGQLWTEGHFNVGDPLVRGGAPPLDLKTR